MPASPSQGVPGGPYVCFANDGTPYASSEDNDRDGTPDCQDSDDDNDRLSDRVERALGLDQFDADTDRDGIQDGIDLEPTLAGSTIRVMVRVALLEAIDTCGDGDAWDPYFAVMTLLVPGKAVDFVLSGWTKSNHPHNYDGSDPRPLPYATTVVPADATSWNLIVFPYPWTRTQAGMKDEDWLNGDDDVHLDGDLTSLQGEPLSIVSGTLGHANAGTKPCMAKIAMANEQGIDAVHSAVAVQLARGSHLVRCEDIGFPPDCGGPEPSSQGQGLLPDTDPGTLPDAPEAPGQDDVDPGSPVPDEEEPNPEAPDVDPDASPVTDQLKAFIDGIEPPTNDPASLVPWNALSCTCQSSDLLDCPGEEDGSGLVCVVLPPSPDPAEIVDDLPKPDPDSLIDGEDPVALVRGLVSRETLDALLNPWMPQEEAESSSVPSVPTDDALSKVPTRMGMTWIVILCDETMRHPIAATVAVAGFDGRSFRPLSPVGMGAGGALIAGIPAADGVIEVSFSGVPGSLVIALDGGSLPTTDAVLNLAVAFDPVAGRPTVVDQMLVIPEASA